VNVSPRVDSVSQRLCGVFKRRIVDLEAQREQLHALAEARGIDLAPVGELPDDPRLRIAALATLLRIDPMAALRGNVPVRRLAAEARKEERALEQFERQERKLLRDLGAEIEEGA
jgi:hypothetical protein